MSDFVSQIPQTHYRSSAPLVSDLPHVALQAVFVYPLRVVLAAEIMLL